MVSTKRRGVQAFSLVEVVIALAIVVFAGFGLLGLLGTGLQGNHESKEQLQAANIVEYLCSIRRAAPNINFSGTNSSNPQPGFPLPALGTATNNMYSAVGSGPAPVFVTWDGVTTNATSGPAAFGLLFSITPSTNAYPTVAPASSTVYLCLYWPPSSVPNISSGHFEVTTTFYLP